MQQAAAAQQPGGTPWTLQQIIREVKPGLVHPPAPSYPPTPRPTRLQQIIFEVQPDLIIETGTANGGSALMWASILHLLGRGGRVMTLDLEPAQKTNFGANKANPWDSPLWKQYVTFVQVSCLPLA